MAYFTMDKIAEIKESVTQQDFLMVLGQYGIPVQKNSILCPFHQDQHFGSAIISQGRNNAYCFVCQRVIDVFGIIMQEEGVDFSEAVKIYWCDIIGNPVPEQKNLEDWRPGWKDLEFIGLGRRKKNTQVAFLNMVPRLERRQLPAGWVTDRERYGEAEDAFACGRIVRPVSIHGLPDEEFWPLAIGKAKENLEYREARLKETENPLTLAGHECCTDKKSGQEIKAKLQEDVRRAKYLVSRMEDAYLQVKEKTERKEKAQA